VNDEERDEESGVYILENLRVNEVSLVDRAANGRRFLVWKRDEGSENVKDTIQAVADVATEKEATLVESVAKYELSEDAQAALVSAHRLLEGFSDEIPAEALREFGLAAASEEVEEEETVEASAELTEEAVAEPSEEEVAKSAEVEPVLKAAQDRIAELEAILKSERDEQILKADIKRASEDFGSIPGVESEALGRVINELRKAAPDSLKALETTLDRIAKAHEAGTDGAFVEVGKSTPVVESGSALDRIEQLVQERIAKGLNDDRPSAFQDVTRLHPEVYGEYYAERFNK
jgi:hypothetical protein